MVCIIEEYNSKDILALNICNDEIAKKNILALNEKTQEFGLVLTEEQIKNLIEVRNNALIDNSLIELGSDVLEKIISEFYSSPYISKIDYDETLYELVEIFYEIRENFNYKVTDEYIIELMREYYDNYSKGSTINLAKKVMDDIFGIKEKDNSIVWDIDE